MINARTQHATVVVDGKLYVIGGYDHGELSSVECLDLEQGQWLEVAPMITARRFHGAAVLGRLIFVAGGSPVGTSGTSVESFDPATNQWTAVNALTHRHACGATSQP